MSAPTAHPDASAAEAVPAVPLLTAEHDVPDAGDVEALLLETWESYLGAEEPAVPWQPEPGAEDQVAWSASVCFEGSWRALVALEVHGSTAEQAARELLALGPDEEVLDADVADAVGELVNILGGAVKSLVAAEGTLSLPVVASGRVAAPRASTHVCAAALRWRGRTVTVHLYAVLPSSACPTGARVAPAEEKP